MKASDSSNRVIRIISLVIVLPLLLLSIVAFSPRTNAAGTRVPLDFDGDGKSDYAVVRNVGGGPGGMIGWLIANVNVTIPAGPNITIQTTSGDARVNFAQVTAAGGITFMPINPLTVGRPPAGYTIPGFGPAYEISTTANYTPPVSVCLTAASVNDPTLFAGLRILHGEGGQLVDRTILAPDWPSPDFPSRRICARVQTLSPFVLAFAPGVALPPNFIVTNTNDSGAGSLRQAILDANAASSSDVIGFDASVFNVPRTITLTSGDLVISNAVFIDGPGSGQLTVSGNNASKIFTITETPVVAIDGMTLTSGNGVGISPGNNLGGAIYNQGDLTLNDLVVTGNSAAGDGGGIYNSPGDELVINNSVISNNTSNSDNSGSGNGGGIHTENAATLIVANSIISGNKAQGGGSGGGGIRVDGGTATITDSTISGNMATDVGGGVNVRSTTTITRSTISGNTSGSDGGGIASSSTLTLANCTVSGNTAADEGGGIFRSGTAALTITSGTIVSNTAARDGGGITASAATIGNTIIANNVENGTGIAPDYDGSFTSQGYNLIKSTTGTTITGTTTGNILGQDPNLGPLQNNGGSMQTHALLANSPAIDKGNSFSLTTDERSLPRLCDDPAILNASDGADIGAFELQLQSLQFNVAGYSVGENGTAIITVNRTGGTQGAASVQYATGGGSAIGNSGCSAGVDYQTAAGTLNFASGETSKTFTVTICDDAAVEGDETIGLSLSLPTGVALGPLASAFLTILDNEAAPTPTPTPTPTATPTPTPTAIVGFSASSYSVQEDCTFVTVTVNRTGDTSTAASVDYSSADATATERRDYITALGTLQFAAGETSKTFAVLINEDSYVEGNETFNLSLSNPSGFTLGAPAAATVTITDDASEPATNIIDDASTYVCQHYHDFLNRQPDQSGWDFWTSQITSCNSDQACIEARRVNVSASFFLSIEFQQTGYLVERSYKAAYADPNGSSTFGGAHQLPVPTVRFTEFLSDSQRITRGVVVLQSGWEQLLENNKQAFFLELVQRSRFTTALPTTMTPTEFVDRLNQNAANVLSASERTTAINLFSGAANTTNTTARAQALRQVAEDQDLQTAEFNRAFVLMQYLGYLRRNPNDPQDTDYSGYDFWLTKLNQFNGNYINAEMVKAFITSIEYGQRFGP